MNTRTRRNFITLCGGILATAPVASAALRNQVKSQKKGWAGGNEDRHKEFGANWYYNWTPNIEGSKLEFVPMIKGGWNVNDNDFGKVGGYRRLEAMLSFNEPERGDQGNLTVDAAIDLWPKLARLAKRERIALGSPVTSSDDKGMRWFHEFMKQAGDNDLQIDFVALHWYRSRDANQFEDFIEELAKRYDKPIWLTEFNGGPDGDIKEHFRFLENALKFLEKSRFVKRYAFFNPAPGDPYSLCDKRGKPTPLGELYKAAGG